MGVEEVQKINTLAKELLKHHIASSSEDAFARAELMVKGETPTADNKEDEVNRELRQLGLKINSLYTELVNLRQEFKLIKDDVSSIKKKVEGIGSERRQFEQPIVQSQPVENKEQQPISQEPKKTETRSRTGDFKEKDVEIEKFFYYGNKK